MTMTGKVYKAPIFRPHAVQCRRRKMTRLFVAERNAYKSATLKKNVKSNENVWKSVLWVECDIWLRNAMFVFMLTNDGVKDSYSKSVQK